MSANTSPMHYNDLEDAFISDAHFKVDISQKMQVPTKISFNTDTNMTNGIHYPSNHTDNINMQVPERILVAGQDQHVGTRAPPREIVYDHSLMPSDPYPGDVRVATPPRTLTLDRYPFPGLKEKVYEEEKIENKLPVVKKFNLNDSDLNMSMNMSHREMTPPLTYGGGEGLTAPEEVLHLRRQLAKLNRRVNALELENLNRLQKEKLLYGFGIAYFLLKTIIWLNRT